MWPESLLALDMIPDGVLRRGVRWRLRRQLDQLERHARGDPAAQVRRAAERLRREPKAVETDAANRQHDEVPARFFVEFLAPG